MLNKKIRGYTIKQILIGYGLIAIGFMFAFLDGSKVMMASSIFAAVFGAPIIILIGTRK